MTDDDELSVLEVLERVHKGELVVAAVVTINDASWFGDATYSISNGWSIVVFIDGGEFDYIDSVTTNDGTVFDFDEIWKLAETEYGTITPRKDGWNRLRNYRGCVCNLKGNFHRSHKQCVELRSRIWGFR